MISLTFGILLAYVAGSVLGTQVVLNNVAAMGLEVTLAMRWSSSLSDVAGLAGTLLPLMAIALLPGWLILGLAGSATDHACRTRVVHPDGCYGYRGTASSTQLGVRRRRLCARENNARPVGAGTGRWLGRGCSGTFAPGRSWWLTGIRSKKLSSIFEMLYARSIADQQQANWRFWSVVRSFHRVFDC